MHSNHTPAPWEHIIVNNQSAIRAKRNGKTCLVASCLHDEDNEPTIEELDANGSLIAAAPDLLEACKAARDFVIDIIENTAEPDLESCVDIRETANTALQKAEGK